MAIFVASAQEALESLNNSTPLAIVKLSDSLSIPDDAETGTNRSSDVSADNAYTDMHPASLREDLVHYEELFKKLRFSYLEQVTKERFLRSLTSDTPIFIEPQENADLETKLLEEKLALKAQKKEVAKMVSELEAMARSLAKRHEQVQLQKAKLGELPPHIAELESAIEELRSSHPSPRKSDNPNLNLSLADTQSLLAKREVELASLNSQLSVLQSTLPRKTRELERLESELEPLQNQKKFAVAQAKEARKRREEGGVDEMEEKGRWYRASELALTNTLGVQS